MWEACAAYKQLLVLDGLGFGQLECWNISNESNRNQEQIWEMQVKTIKD